MFCSRGEQFVVALCPAQFIIEHTWNLVYRLGSDKSTTAPQLQSLEGLILPITVILLLSRPFKIIDLCLIIYGVGKLKLRNHLRDYLVRSYSASALLYWTPKEPSQPKIAADFLKISCRVLVLVSGIKYRLVRTNEEGCRRSTVKNITISSSVRRCNRHTSIFVSVDAYITAYVFLASGS